jgi:hypothetical protein
MVHKHSDVRAAEDHWQVEGGQGGNWNETSSLLRWNDLDNVLIRPFDFLHPTYGIIEFTVIETCDRDIISNTATWILQNAG